MPKPKKDPKRERRITMGVVVDCYGPDERAMGWYCYLEEKLEFPFTAVCIAERAVWPLRKWDNVEVLEMAPEDECRHEMFVGVRWERRSLAVPLSQLRPIAETDKQT